MRKYHLDSTTISRPDDAVNPKHYVGVTADGIELQAVDVGEAFGLNHHRSTAIEYLIRAGRKPGQAEAIDLAKARWWIDRELDRLAAENGTEPEEGEESKGDQPDTNDCVLSDILAELHRATLKHPPIQSVHEGVAIIREEFDELWEVAKRRDPDPARLHEEAVQVAAMAARFVRDLLYDEPVDLAEEPAPSARDLYAELHALADRIEALGERERGA
jgi:hypothetical protein